MKVVERHLVPGGYIEQVEMGVVPTSDDGSHRGTVYEKWGKASLESGDRFGKTLRIVDESKQRMIDAGFIEVVERRYKLPIGPWPKDKHLKMLGKYCRLVVEESMEMWTMYLWTNVLGVSACHPQSSQSGY
jgi:hypothetical protein